MLLEGNSAKSPRPRRTAADRVRNALAELHGGRMNIVSRQGEGTTVTLTLPILAQSRQAVIEDHPKLEVHDRIRLAQTVGADIAGDREDDLASASS